MSNYMLFLSYNDERDRSVETLTKVVDLNSIAIHNNGSFIDISIYKCNSLEMGLIQRIILPANKLNKVELVDLEDSNCPLEYIELAVKEQMKNGT